MVNTVKQIVNRCNTEAATKTYNILTFPTHERYESQLAKTGHNFYSFNLENMKKWNKDQIKPPENYYILPEGDLCEFINYDFILVQSKFWQFQVAQQINQRLGIPIIVLEHTLPTPQTISEQNIEMMRKMVGDINIFISEYSQKAWNINAPSHVIHHGIDSETFRSYNTPRSNEVLTVANDFVNRDYCLNYSGWKRVTSGLNTKLVGDTKGLSVAASSTAELVMDYNTCGVYFNSSTLSPIPTSLLEAMSCGCAVVSTATCMIPEIIKNGHNGFISNNENELKEYIQSILSDSEKKKTLGAAARNTILEQFSENKFLQKWNDVFNATYEVSKK
jgi:glycosyltransferase involved in cell wall biosynthesis